MLLTPTALESRASMRLPPPPSTSSLRRLLHPQTDLHAVTDSYPHLVLSLFSYLSCPIHSSQVSTTFFTRCTVCTTLSCHVLCHPLSCRFNIKPVAVGTRSSIRISSWTRVQFPVSFPLLQSRLSHLVLNPTLSHFAIIETSGRQ